MKKTVMALSLGLGLFLGVIFMTPTFSVAKAGFEPSPFQPEINQLGAVANILHSADFRVARNISHPPDPCVPPDPCKGLEGDINRIEAIQNQVSSADDMVKAMIEEVMGFEPMPFRAEDLIPPLQIVKDAAGGIALRIEEFMAGPPDPDTPTVFLGALDGVAHKAIDIVTTAEDGIEQLSGSMECSAYTTNSDCDGVDDCVWIIDAIVPYCAADMW
jgi:hypothetical protein